MRQLMLVDPPWELVKEFEVSAEHIAQKAAELMKVKRAGAAEKREHVFAGAK